MILGVALLKSVSNQWVSTVFLLMAKNVKRKKTRFQHKWQLSLKVQMNDHKGLGSATTQHH
jgi:hypothetical protein